MSTNRFRTIEPKILYFGTPVALISSVNEDGGTNLAPISSFWALGWNVVLGLLNDTKTIENLRRQNECVVNIPSPDLWEKVERLASLTGKNPVPDEKADRFHFENDKFQAAGLTHLPAELVEPTRVAECPVHMEARVIHIQRMRGAKLESLGGGTSVEVEILRVHVDEDLIKGDDHIDPDKWSPLLYNFRHYYRLANEELGKTFRATS